MQWGEVVDRIHYMAQEVGNYSDADLTTVIGNLISEAFKRYKLLTDECLEVLTQDNPLTGQSVPDVLVNAFIMSYRPDYTQTINDGSVYDQARDYLCEFLRAYAGNYLQRTIHATVYHEIPKRFPGVSIYKLLRDPEVRRLMVDQIKIAVGGIVASKMNELFRRERSSFIKGYLYDRVLYEEKDSEGKYRLVADQATLRRLLEFLIDQRYPKEEERLRLDDLYMLLYREFHAQYEIIHRQRETRRAIGKAAGDRTMAASETSSDKQPLDYDDFFHHQIQPAIREVKRTRMPQTLQLVDINLVDPDFMQEHILPAEAIEPLKTLLREIETEGFGTIKKKLGFGQQFSDRQVQRVIEDRLNAAKKQIEYSFENGLRRRAPYDPIHQRAVYLPEILNEKKLENIIKWIVRPEDFTKQYPQHRDVSPYIIRHQARIMLELFQYYPHVAYVPEVRQLDMIRNIVEGHMLEKLDVDMDSMQQRRLWFRILQEIDPKTHKPILDESGNPKYDVMYEEVGIDEKAKNGSLQESKGHEQNVHQYKGKVWKKLPVEHQDFQVFTIAIRGSDDQRRNIKMRVWSHNGEIINKKDMTSYVSSYMRKEEKPGDAIRWCSIFDTVANASAFCRDFIYGELGVGKMTRVQDAGDKRSKQVGKRRTAARGQKQFADLRYLTATIELSIPVLDPAKNMHAPDAIQFINTPLETQVFDGLGKFAMGVSEWANTGHNTEYTPRREFDNLVRFYCPPVILGSWMAEEAVKGYKNGTER